MSKYPHYINVTDHIDEIWTQLKEHFLSYKEEPLFISLQKLILKMQLKDDNIDTYSLTFGLKFTRYWKRKIFLDEPDVGSKLYEISFYTRFAKVNPINNEEYGMVMYDIVDKDDTSNVPYASTITRFTALSITTKWTVSAAINCLIANYDTGYFRFIDANTKEASNIDLNLPIKFDMINNGSHLEDDEIIKFAELMNQEDSPKRTSNITTNEDKDNTMYIELDQYRDKIWDAVKHCFINEEDECKIDFDPILLSRKSGSDYYLIFHIVFIRKTDKVDFSSDLKYSKSKFFFYVSDSCLGCFSLQASIYASTNKGMILKKQCNVTSKDEKYNFKDLDWFSLSRDSSSILTSKQDVLKTLNCLFELFKTGYFRFKETFDNKACMIRPSHPIKFKPFSKITAEESNPNSDILHVADLKKSDEKEIFDSSIGKMEFNLVTKKELPDELNINGVLYRKVSTDM